MLGTLATAVVFDFKEFRISRSIRARVINQAILSLQPTLPYSVSDSHEMLHVHVRTYTCTCTCMCMGQSIIVL